MLIKQKSTYNRQQKNDKIVCKKQGYANEAIRINIIDKLQFNKNHLVFYQHASGVL